MFERKPKIVTLDTIGSLCESEKKKKEIECSIKIKETPSIIERQPIVVAKPVVEKKEVITEKPKKQVKKDTILWL